MQAGGGLRYNTKMEIGLINFYEVEENLRPAHGDYPAMFARLLKDGGLDTRWRTYDARAGELPQTPDECDGYLMTGSKHAVYENHEWLPPLFAFIRALRAARAPRLAGVCFGHQAVAQALGGRAEKSAKGWGSGRQTWQLCGDAEWLRPRLAEFSLLASHQDQVVELPPEAELLAASAFCPLAMFAVGTQFFCMQGHPEFSPAFCDALLDGRRDKMPPDVWQRAKESAPLANEREVCAKWLAAFFCG